MRSKHDDAPGLAPQGVNARHGSESRRKDITRRHTAPARRMRVGLPAGFLRALEALHGPFSPLLGEELAAFNAARAREMARAEERRRLWGYPLPWWAS